MCTLLTVDLSKPVQYFAYFILCFSLAILLFSCLIQTFLPHDTRSRDLSSIFFLFVLCIWSLLLKFSLTMTIDLSTMRLIPMVLMMTVWRRTARLLNTNLMTLITVLPETKTSLLQRLCSLRTLTAWLQTPTCQHVTAILVPYMKSSEQLFCATPRYLFNLQYTFIPIRILPV